jgi:electron transfer flavoprotein beta subunit
MKEVIDARLPVLVVAGAIKPGEEDGPIRLVNPADRAALEVALAVKERAGGTVDAFSVADVQQQGALVYALACGVDAAFRVEPDTSASTPLATATQLAEAISARGRYDLICCGDETLDNASAAVGPLLAELLGMTQVTSACALEGVVGDQLVLVRRLDRGHREVVEADLPLVVTFVPEAARARYVSRRMLAQAALREIPVAEKQQLKPAAHALQWATQEKRVSPRARIKKRFAPEANLSAADRVNSIMGGGSSGASTSASTSTVEGEPDFVVEQLYRFLKHHEFI